jgi:pyruvate-ferredoxin/flavodoxin oxidoreductase
LGDDAALAAAKLALESRAFPLMIYDPSAGPALADQLSLDGNPMLDEVWPTYDLRYTDQEGKEQTLTLPMTVADWAATEARFKKHFKVVRDDVDADVLLRFDEFLAASPEDRAGKTPYIHALSRDGQLYRLSVSHEIVELAEDRLALWHQLRQMAGLELADSARDSLAGEIESAFEQKAEELKAEHARTVTELKTKYPAAIARRMAEGLVRATDNGQERVADLLKRVQEMRSLEPLGKVDLGGGNGGTAVAAAPAGSAAPATVAAPATAAAAPAAAEEAEEEEGLGLDPYIQSELCTACNECTNLNKRMFAYNDKKQAYIKDAKAGTFRELVQAAEKCPVAIIHPGTPLNPKEKDLDKWVKRAERFN